MVEKQKINSLKREQFADNFDKIRPNDLLSLKQRGSQRPVSSRQSNYSRRASMVMGSLVTTNSNNDLEGLSSEPSRTSRQQKDAIKRLSAGRSAQGSRKLKERKNKPSRKPSIVCDSTGNLLALPRGSIKQSGKQSAIDVHREPSPDIISNYPKKKMHIKPINELPGFPMDMVKMKIRNRKLLASLNTKKRFKDFEYKNYDSTDSDIYEEEDYLKIRLKDVEEEPDFLRKRRMQRRFEKKLAIQNRIKQEKEAGMLKKHPPRNQSESNQTPVKMTKQIQGNIQYLSNIEQFSPKNSKMLNELFAQLIDPKIKVIKGQAKSKVDSGLDEPQLNYFMSEDRRKKREKDFARRSKNPLTYPAKNETLQDQQRFLPTQSTLAKLGILGQKTRYMGNIELENMIMDNMSKYGLMRTSSEGKAQNPALLREAFRPSLITQHINFQSKKIWKKAKATKKSIKDKIRRENENKGISNARVSSSSSSSFESLDIVYQSKQQDSDCSSQVSKQRRQDRRAQRKNRAAEARQALRKMNQMGLENQKGFDPSMLQKLDKKQTQEDIEKKRDQRSMQRKQEEQVFDRLLGNKRNSKLRNQNESEIDDLYSDCMSNSGKKKQSKLASQFSSHHQKKPRLTVIQVASLDNDQSTQNDSMQINSEKINQLNELKQVSQWRLKSLKGKQSKITTSDKKQMNRRNLQENKARFKQQSQRPLHLRQREGMHNQSMQYPLESHRTGDSRNLNISQSMNNHQHSVQIHSNKQSFIDMSPLRTAKNSASKDRTFDFERARFVKTNSMNNRLLKVQQKLADIQTDIKNFQEDIENRDHFESYQETGTFQSTDGTTFGSPTHVNVPRQAHHPPTQMQVRGNISIHDSMRRDKPTVGTALPGVRNSQAYQQMVSQMQQSSGGVFGNKRVSTAGHDPAQEHQSSIGYDSTDEKNTSILYDWDRYGVADKELVRDLFNDAIDKILDSMGGCPEPNLNKIPNCRTSMDQMIQRVSRKNDMQMVPNLPKVVSDREMTEEQIEKSKVSVGFLEAQKQAKVYQAINQTLNAMGDEDHKQKYYQYMLSKGIKIVSDIFERMDMDRKICESLRQLKALDNLSEEQYLEKKKRLMRKLTSKATVYLYEKQTKEKRVTLQTMAMRMEEQTLVKRAMNNEEAATAEEATAHNLIRNTISKAMDLSHIFKKNQNQSMPKIPGLDFGLGKAITERDDNSSDIKHEVEDSSDTSSYQSSEFDEIKELKARVGLIAQNSLGRMSKDKNTSFMSSKAKSKTLKKSVNFDQKQQPSGFSIGVSALNKTPVQTRPPSIAEVQREKFRNTAD